MRPRQRLGNNPLTETAVQLLNHRQDLLALGGNILNVPLVSTVAAMTTRRTVLTKVAHNILLQALRGTGIVSDRLEFLVLQVTVVVVRGRLVNKPAVLPQVVRVVNQDRFTRQAISARPACFLVVGFNVLRSGRVNHEADVALVNSHPKGTRSHNRADPVKLKIVLNPGPGRRIHSGMVTRDCKMVFQQVGCQFVHSPAGIDVNNPGFLSMGLQVFPNVTPGTFFRVHHPKTNIGPGKAGDNKIVLLNCQLLPNVFLHRRGRRRGQR